MLVYFGGFKMAPRAAEVFMYDSLRFSTCKWGFIGKRGHGAQACKPYRCTNAAKMNVTRNDVVNQGFPLLLSHRAFPSKSFRIPKMRDASYP